MEWYSFLNHPLTTIDQSPYQMGKAAGETLLQKISGKRKNPKRVLSPSRLIVRESTARVAKGRR
jgi:LacI family transcriptional regulator